MNGNAGRLVRADLHVHTRYSPDSLSRVQDVLSSAVKKGLGAIAITDHNGIEGALEASRIARQRRLPLQVIIGEEVATDKGDLLIYFLKRKIEPGPLGQVLKDVKKQGAACCAAHPYDFARHGIALEKLPGRELAAIDAIEAFNARITLNAHNASALLFCQKAGKPFLAGSDAHHPCEVGAAYAEFDLAAGKELDAKALLLSPRKIGGNLSSPLVHFFSRYAKAKRRILGLKPPRIK
jgi:predicted metal-dependent phosphoesterase TrpH